MDDESAELRGRLADLHRQLQTTGKVDPDLHALLVDVLSDIAHVLEEQGRDEYPPASIAGEPQNLAGRLAEAARQFEDTHPNLSATIGSVITALSRTGI